MIGSVFVTKLIGLLVLTVGVCLLAVLWPFWGLIVGLPLALIGLGLRVYAKMSGEAEKGAAHATGLREWDRTLVFLCTALMVTVAAASSRPSLPGAGAAVNAKFPMTLFEDFVKPEHALLANSMEIITVDEDLNSRKVFEVEQRKGLWVLPSHDGYPADAEDQMQSAAVSLLNVEALDSVSDSVEDHELYGVVEPTVENVQNTAKGIGTLVTLKDAKEDALVRLIVGKKAVESAGDEEAEDDAELRFVRIPSQTAVLVAKIDLDKLSTNFDDWIEKDLLKITPFDVEHLTLKDYSIVQFNLRPTMQMRFNMSVRYESGSWELDELITYTSNQEGTPAQLADDEELDDTKLNDLRNALDDLKIVDVRRKPAGLGADLKADRSFGDNEESVQSLVSRGFFPQPNEDGTFDILATNGELLATQKNGVEYLLRFGSIASSNAGQDEGINRYLMVSTRFNEDVLEKPEYEEVPALPKAESNAGEAKEEGEKKEGEKSEIERERERIEAERARIEKENTRKREEYEEKVKQATKTVNELNHRFADWYYVISEDVYKKLRLSRSDVIKEKEGATEEGFGPDAFRELESQGLKKKTPAP